MLFTLRCITTPYLASSPWFTSPFGNRLYAARNAGRRVLKESRRVESPSASAAASAAVSKRAQNRRKGILSPPPPLLFAGRKRHLFSPSSFSSSAEKNLAVRGRVLRLPTEQKKKRGEKGGVNIIKNSGRTTGETILSFSGKLSGGAD